LTSSTIRIKWQKSQGVYSKPCCFRNGNFANSFAKIRFNAIPNVQREMRRRSVRRLFHLYTAGKLRRETFPGLACMQLDRQQNSLRKIPQCMFGSSIVGPQRRLISTVRWRQEEFNSSSELSILSIRQGMFCQPNCGGTYRPFCSISDS